MRKTNPMLLIDFYKGVHAEMLPKGITKSVSYFTPRMSRVDMWDFVVNFGLQGFIKTYLIDYFNEEFFNQPEEEVIRSYKRIMDNALGEGVYNLDKIRRLHQLGYLPIEIISLPEGAKVPMHVPMFGITNTHPDFAWLPQALESLISAEMWHPMLAATVGYSYRQIVNKYFDLTCDESALRTKALSNFDFRGEECLQSAVKAGAGWLLSFTGTATVPAIPYIEENYYSNCELNAHKPLAFGAISTEHSIMCSNYAIDEDEISLLRRLLTEIYPNTSFSAVLDSYDYWNVVENILPQLKKEIMEHNGCFLIRGDSGDCVEVVTKTVFKLWDIFGGTVNSKGYKVLDPHVKAIYGDSITIQRCEKIYKILMENGFAASNVVLGAGSFSFQCIEENDVLKPFTRDTFSSCIKATYCEINDKPHFIFKNPKDGGFKKSQKGCCVVRVDKSGKYIYADGFTWEEAYAESAFNELRTVFKDGSLVIAQDFEEIRQRLHEGGFYG